MRYIKHGVMLETVEWKEGDGRNDSIVRSAYAAMAYRNLGLLQGCKMLCVTRKRWPDELGKPSKRMTRDPYIMTICAIALLTGQVTAKLVDETIIPFFSGGRMLYRPHLWAWRKYLITGEEKWKRRYERRAILGLKLSKNRMFSLCLEAWMAYAADSDKVKRAVLNRSPFWNYLITILTAHDRSYGFTKGAILSFMGIEASLYKPKERNQWTEETWRDTGYYDGEFQIDKDILTYLLER